MKIFFLGVTILFSINAFAQEVPTKLNNVVLDPKKVEQHDPKFPYNFSTYSEDGCTEIFISVKLSDDKSTFKLLRSSVTTHHVCYPHRPMFLVRTGGIVEPEEERNEPNK